MGSLPLIHLSSITNDVTMLIAISLFYGAILWFIFVLLRRLQSKAKSRTTGEKKNEDSRIMDVCNVFKFIRNSIFISASKKSIQNVSIVEAFRKNKT